MKKKQNVYKRKRNFHIFSAIPTVLFSLILVSFFAVVGYSVAKPFAKIGEAEIASDVDVKIEEPTSAEEPVPEINETCAFWLAEKEIEDIETLEAVLGRVSDEYNTIVIPLKIEGGKLNYKSYNEGAVMAEVGTETELSDIISTIKRNGFRPIASINLMEDNLYPLADKAAGFSYAETGKLWYDSDPKNGGRAWLSPSSSTTKNYLSALTTEIANAGFEKIIVTDAQYPEFSRLGFDDIGESVTNENRYLDLIDVVNLTAKAAHSKNSQLWAEIPAAEMIKGTCEVFQPMLLESDKTVLKINLDDFNGIMTCNNEIIDFSTMTVTEKIAKICSIAENYIYKTSFVPEITGTKFTSSDKISVREFFAEEGYTSYILR
ncbi:MAG: hypothetical protein IJN85_01990 [Oscillospiraceae bacterium]|nr:hypothetical protein [Oscillospiraceae bacterium]